MALDNHDDDRHRRVGGIPALLAIRINRDLKSREVMGRTGNGNKKPYISKTSLLEYWQVGNIEEVLQGAQLHYSPLLIRDKYLCVFSTLVRINRIEYLDCFIKYVLFDSKGPLYSFHDDWPEYFHNSFFDEFQLHKWTFFPLEFDRLELIKRRLDHNYILPLTIQDVMLPTTSGSYLEDDTTSKVYKIEIHEPCNKLAAPFGTNTFALKAWPNSPDNIHDYERERDAYRHIHHFGRCDSVVKLYGSFEQSETSYLILELVEGGSLQQYLNQTQPPQTPSDIHDFWSSMSGLFDAIRKAHKPDPNSGQQSQKGIIHGDLKFDNIFVVKDPASEYKFQVKLADFGCSSFASCDAEGSLPQGRDQRGNATFSAPETSRHRVDLDDGPDVITTAADIWALGCLIIDLAAWVTGGKFDVQKFSDRRAEELEQNPYFKGSGHTRCFHDGADVLTSVRTSCELFRQRRMDGDIYTPAIIDIALNNALVGSPHQRMAAKQLLSAIRDALKSRPSFSSPRSSEASTMPGTITNQICLDCPGKDPTDTPSTPKDVTPPEETAVRVSRPITIEKLREFQTSQRDGRPLDEEMKADIKLQIEPLIKNLKGRDHLFFLENSESMREHRELVLKIFKCLSGIAEKIDSDHLELAFASSPMRIHKSKNSSRLMTILAKQEYECLPGLMENQLYDFMRKAIFPKLSRPPNIIRRIFRWHVHRKPLTVIIITDGKWGDGDVDPGAGVQNPIRVLMDRMRRHHLTRTHVTLQFLRLGDDEVGKKHLTELDNFGRKEKFDIVDTRSANDGLVSIFVSSISEAHDNRRSTASEDYGKEGDTR